MLQDAPSPNTKVKQNSGPKVTEDEEWASVLGLLCLLVNQRTRKRVISLLNFTGFLDDVVIKSIKMSLNYLEWAWL